MYLPKMRTYLIFALTFLGSSIFGQSPGYFKMEGYKDKISFVLLSIDRDEKAWKNAIGKYKLALPGFHHYRIGPDADLLKFFEVGTIPRYLLIKKNGESYDLNAKRPSDPRLGQDFEILMNEAGVKN
jgi:hypothetical protein